MECGFGHEIAVHSFGLLVVTRICLGILDCINDSILFNTVIILHHWFLYLRPWVFFHVTLWFHASHSNWFDQIDRTCALVRQVSAQLIQFHSSAGVFSYENLIFLLSFGYHSYFSGIQLIVPLYVHDATFVVERATMVARNVILGKLAEAVVGRLNSDDVTSFLLAHWLGVHSGSECFRWIPIDTTTEDIALMAVKHSN